MTCFQAGGMKRRKTGNATKKSFPNIRKCGRNTGNNTLSTQTVQGERISHTSLTMIHQSPSSNLCKTNKIYYSQRDVGAELPGVAVGSPSSPFSHPVLAPVKMLRLLEGLLKISRPHHAQTEEGFRRLIKTTGITFGSSFSYLSL